MTTFEAALERYLQQLDSGQNVSEDTIRDRFFTFLREAFPHLKAPRQVKLEEYVPGLAVCGRADALLGEVIIEFKRQLDTESKREAAIEQLDRYLRNANKLYGIITDGKRLIARARHNDNFKNISEIVALLHK